LPGNRAFPKKLPAALMRIRPDMKPLRTRTVHGWEEISRLQIAIFHR
jgi:hypothetical protein